MLRTYALACLAACSFRSGDAVGPASDGRVDASSEAAPDAPATTATLFVTDYTMNTLARFALSATPGPPPPPLAVTLPGAESPIFVPSTGELLVGQFQAVAITTFATPLTTPTVTGTITGNGLTNNFGKIIPVDSELWLIDDGSVTGLDRIALSQGSATMTGSAAITNPRGMVFDPTTRDLYVTQCCGTDTILHFHVAADHSLTSEASLTGNGLNNPHGMWITPWGELLVSDAGASMILRFTRDGTGALTANGMITGNGLNLPIDLVMTPWDELYVANQGNATISRFQFDAMHDAMPNGMFPVPSGGQISWLWVY